MDQAKCALWRIYFWCFQRYFNSDVETVLATIPQDQFVSKYYASSDQDYSGYECYFYNMDEVDRFIEGLNQLAGGRHKS